jgi:small-conductance mechanosensitive channel
MISDLNFAVWETFRKNNIEIPFPQTDLHIRSGNLKMKNDRLEIASETDFSDEGTELEDYENEESEKKEKQNS